MGHSDDFFEFLKMWASTYVQRLMYIQTKTADCRLPGGYTTRLYSIQVTTKKKI